MTESSYVVPQQPPTSGQEPVQDRWPVAVWIIPDFVIALVVTLIVSLVVFIGYFSLQALRGVELAGIVDLQTTGIPPTLLFISVLLQNLVFVGVALFRTRVLRRLPWQWLGFVARRFGRLVLLGIVFGIFFFALNVATSWIFSRFGIEADQAEMFMVEPGDILGYILLFLGVAIVAPIGEEIFFRGYVFRALHENSSRRVVGIIALQALLLVGLIVLGTWLGGIIDQTNVVVLGATAIGVLFVSFIIPSMRLRAYLLSAAFFAVLHLSGITQGASAVMVTIFLGGLLLAWAFDLTGSLVPSIIAHMINNSVAVAQIIWCVDVHGSIQQCV
jgi:membrane protease YdiL (CAAX protease family)